MEYADRNEAVPDGFTTGDIALLGISGYDAYMHTLICTSKAIDTYKFSCHTNDKKDVALNTDWPWADLAHFYHITPSQCTFSGSWGEIKGWFADDLGVGSPSGIAEGFYEPRSSEYSRLAWPEFADSAGMYSILRRVDDDEVFETIDWAEAGDTVFIDSTVTTGHTYHYRVVSEHGDTLMHTDEMSFGLLMTSELYFYGINGLPDYIETLGGDTVYAEYSPEAGFMIADGQYIYLACKDRVKKIDVSNPENPVEVGSRDISSYPFLGFSPDVKDLGIGEEYCTSGYLFVLTDLYLIIIDKTDNSLPIVSSISDFGSEGCECNALVVMGHIAYVATNCGISAVSFYNPSSPEVWGTYTGIGASEDRSVTALERVDDYLYVEITGNDLCSCYSEILETTVFDYPGSVYFDVICTDHDDPICFDYEFDLTATNGMSYRPLRGNPMGYYAAGRMDDTTFAVLNVTDPLTPSVIKTFVTPWSQSDKGGVYDLYNRSYTFDDQYCYVCVGRWQDNPWSAVYVFDLYDGGTEPIYAMGDMEIGQRKSGTVTSWGEYLYYFDKARDDRDYHRLQIFEKADGCDPNLDVWIGPDPIADMYEIGQTCVISWTCNGCPTRVAIELVEDGCTTQLIASLRKFDEPNLQASSIDWSVEGISSDPENHVYNINVLAWNIEGAHDDCSSNTFEIVEELGTGGKGKVPIVGYGIDDGEDRTLPLPAFAVETEDQYRENYLVFPENPIVRKGEITLTIQGCEGKDIFINVIELISLDIPEGCGLTMQESAPMLAMEEREFIPLLSLIEGTDVSTGSVPPIGIERIRQDRIGMGTMLRSGENIDMTFPVAEETVEGERRYMLVYSGLLVEAGDSGEEIPKVFALIDPYPNPFNATTTIEFHMPRKARTVLCLYDATGALVRTMRDGISEPGVHRVVWDGRNNRGGAVASGIYFCRLTVERERVFTKKLVLLR